MAVVRIQNVPLEPRKHVRIALRSIFGIGATRAEELCERVGVKGDTKVQDLDLEVVRLLQNEVAKLSTEGDLKREIAMRIKRLVDIGCYRGKRHRNRLPLRGQRTRTNARTRKGARGNKVSKK
ncbi:MAG: 30S ribosomal protein S13 [Candidatus Berkiella sp.]|jgi:small subunit ribosomal protein S13